MALHLNNQHKDRVNSKKVFEGERENSILVKTVKNVPPGMLAVRVLARLVQNMWA